MASSSVMRRTLQKAAELAGGHKPLARRLRVPLGELEKWIAGGGEPPMAIFLKAVDLVLDEAPYPPAGSEPGDAPGAKDCASGPRYA
jgi:hypothetical protein